jgi:hypothetical protein
MKKLVLLSVLALGMLSFTSDNASEQVNEEGPNDCAVQSWYAATIWCNNRPGGCSSNQFSNFAGLAYDECLNHQQ